jgi:hypothetical protein
MASVSKDLTWKLWNTKSNKTLYSKLNYLFNYLLKLNQIIVDYERGQETSLLLSGDLKSKGQSLVALSPDAYTVAVVTDKQLCFFNGLTAECDQIIENVCNGLYLNRKRI